MKYLFLLFFLCTPLQALDITDWKLPESKRLVEVTFSSEEAHDLPRDRSTFIFLTTRSRVTYYISENERGEEHEAWVGIDGKLSGWSKPEFETQQKAAECLALLMSATPLEAPPPDPNQSVTVRWAEGWIERRFPIKGMPAEIREILFAMGFCDEDLRHCAFAR